MLQRQPGRAEIEAKPFNRVVKRQSDWTEMHIDRSNEKKMKNKYKMRKKIAKGKKWTQIHSLQSRKIKITKEKIRDQLCLL